MVQTPFTMNFTQAHRHKNQKYYSPVGQEHTMPLGSYEQSHFINKNGTTYKPSLLGMDDVATYTTPIVGHGAPVAFDLASNKTVNGAFNAGEEFTINGFFIGQYKLMGGRPYPTQYLGTITAAHTYLAAKGMPQGWIQPRVATELATTPPLLSHDRINQQGKCA